MGRTHVRKFTDPRVLCTTWNAGVGYKLRPLLSPRGTLHPLAENARLLCTKWLWRVVWVVWGREAACNSRSSLRLARWQLQNVAPVKLRSYRASPADAFRGEGGGDPAYLEGIACDVIGTIDRQFIVCFLSSKFQDKRAVVSRFYLVILNRFITNCYLLFLCRSIYLYYWDYHILFTRERNYYRYTLICLTRNIGKIYNDL